LLQLILAPKSRKSIPLKVTQAIKKLHSDASQDFGKGGRRLGVSESQTPLGSSSNIFSLSFMNLLSPSKTNPLGVNQLKELHEKLEQKIIEYDDIQSGTKSKSYFLNSAFISKRIKALCWQSTEQTSVT
jgi:hypothetical protein